MFRFILSRFLLVIPTFIGVTIIAFSFIRLLPGDPIMTMAGERGMDAARYLELKTLYGFDKPLYQQYFIYITDLLTGDFGTSIVTNQSVLSEFFGRFPATLELSICAMIFALVLGIPAGVLASVKKGTFYDQLLMTTTLAGYSMPIFWSGLLAIMFFSNMLGWTPVSGRISLLYPIEAKTGFMLIDSIIFSQKGSFISAASHLVLPVLILGTIPLAVVARQTRSAMIEVLNSDYLRTARAKGLSEYRIVAIHALRNALIPLITVIGLQVGTLIAGAILTETIFSWPGIGKWMVDSIFRRDYQVVQGGLVLISLFVIAVNLTVDLCYGWANPKIRISR